MWQAASTPKQARCYPWWTCASGRSAFSPLDCGSAPWNVVAFRGCGIRRRYRVPAPALAQAKGWPYHLYPWRAFAGLSFGLVAAGLLESTRVHAPVGHRCKSTGIAGAIVVLGMTAIRYARQTSSPSGIEQVYALHEIVVRERAESLAVLSMRTILFPAFPVVNYVPVSWVMRHHSLWFLPGLY